MAGDTIAPVLRARLADRRVSEAQLAETKLFEGFRARSYRDAGGTWTVGYGETTPAVVHAFRLLPMPERVAARLLRRRMNGAPFGTAVRTLRDRKGRPLPLTQAMYDALDDAVFNKGPGIIAASTPLGAALRDHHWHRAAHLLLAYDRDVHGTRWPGLTRRREANARRFLSDLPGPDR